MTPLQFEQQYAPLWDELGSLLDALETRQRGADAARMADLYRRCCEHLALAHGRDYPLHLRERLDALAQRAHRLIYRRHDYGVAKLRRLALIDFPEAVRAHRLYLWAATLAFVLPMIAVGLATAAEPTFALRLLDAEQLRRFDHMYGGGAGQAIGRMRGADTDWQMFGFYILNNISVSFQCFASGLLAGIGSLFFLVFNGLHGGAVAGYLSAHGYGGNFWPFVATHSAFEITAIVISGAAGLALGHALLAPGRRTRLHALRDAAARAVVLIYGVFAMLLVAAAVEAFWSSAAWVSPSVKYSVAAVCWLAVIAYLGLQGRPRAR